MSFFQSNFDGNKITYAIGGVITIRDIIRSENILTKNIPKTTDDRIWVDYDRSELYIGEYTSVKKGKGIQKGVVA